MNAQGRQEYATDLEKHLLSIGLDAHVHATGKQRDALRISWAGMSRPIVYKMMNDEGMQEQIPALGFKKVIFTDDGSFSGGTPQTWTYTFGK